MDPHEEALARKAIGDEAVDEALSALDGFPVIDEPLDPEVHLVVAAAIARRVAVAKCGRTADAA